MRPVPRSQRRTRRTIGFCFSFGVIFAAFPDLRQKRRGRCRAMGPGRGSEIGNGRVSARNASAAADTRRRMSAAARKAVSIRMKKYRAERRKAKAAVKSPVDNRSGLAGHKNRLSKHRRRFVEAGASRGLAWIVLSVVAGIVAAAVLRTVSRNRQPDVGSVSDDWIADHRSDDDKWVDGGLNRSQSSRRPA